MITSELSVWKSLDILIEENEYYVWKSLDILIQGNKYIALIRNFDTIKKI